MKKYLKNTFLVLLLLPVFISGTNDCMAGAEKTNKLQSVEFLSGFGFDKLKQQGNYQFLPFFLGFDFDIKPLSKKIGINYPGLQQFAIEPFGSYVINPRLNAEIGNNFVIKIGVFPEKINLQPYLKGGIGFAYLTQHFHEQATQFNFTEFIGLGAHYFMTKKTAFTIEYRFRHVSNCDIKLPNSGIDSNIVICGLSYSF